MNVLEKCLSQCKGDKDKERKVCEVFKNTLKIAMLQQMNMRPVEQLKPHQITAIIKELGVKEGIEFIRNMKKRY